jgi:hypothetical protein
MLSNLIAVFKYINEAQFPKNVALHIKFLAAYIEQNKSDLGSMFAYEDLRTALLGNCPRLEGGKADMITTKAMEIMKMFAHKKREPHA